jgi:uncharacterized protein (TIGR02145 family)
MRFFILLICLTIGNVFSQMLINVDMHEESKKIAITYDFIHLKKDTTINLEVSFRSQSGEIIVPKKLQGDIRNVHPGQAKKIIWDILSEGIILSGRYSVALKELKEYKTVRIGNQIWLAENLYAARFNNGDIIPEASTAEQWRTAAINKQPAWCYFNNDPNTEILYGKLYNWYAIKDPRGIAPNGWFIPSNGEWNELYVSLGDGNLVANKLKHSKGWDDKNGSNKNGFSAIPNCYRNETGEFICNDVKSSSFWAIDNEEYNMGQVHCLVKDQNKVVINPFEMGNQGEGHPVRCFSNVNFFQEVSLASNVWMKQNLCVFRFRNGDPIPEASSTEEWQNATKNRQPAWCYYNNEPTNSKIYGVLYNWYAISDSRGLAPNGWQIASESDWQKIEKTYGSNFNGRIPSVEESKEYNKQIGLYLKSIKGWETYYNPYLGKVNGNGNDYSGFTGLPGGSRLPKIYENMDSWRNVNDLLFQGIGVQGVWWTNTEKDNTKAFCYVLSSEFGLDPHADSKGWGFSVRCVKAAP